MIDKGNMHAFCPTHNAIETWEHSLVCDKMNDKREDWVNNLDKKLNDVEKKVKAPSMKER